MRFGLVLSSLACAVGMAAASSAVAAFAPVQDPRTCKGHERQLKDCEGLPACHRCEPRDCAFSEWGDWFGAGGCTGVCFRHRDIQTANNECGVPCTGLKQETKRCVSSECVKVPRGCQFSDWSEWSPCGTDFTAQKSRNRTIVVYPQDGGAECNGATNETLPCGRTPAVDCEMSDWGQWTECSVTCGGGFRSQMRRVHIRARLGGRPCEGATRRTSPCSAQSCGEEKPCVLGAWSDWSGCGLLCGLQRYRRRQVEQPAERGGQPCMEAVKETAGCPRVPELPEPCKLSEWAPWTACSRTCDGGQTYRKRRVERGPLHGGSCHEEGLHETRPCGAEPCKPPGTDDCKLSDWGSWSECSAKCGVGVARRERQVLAHAKLGGSGCTASLKETQACYSSKETCDSADCQWGDWEQWSACSCSCGGGTKRRERLIKVAPTTGGAPCSAEDKAEVAPCATQSCEVCIDGAWADWEEWSPCSATCSSGLRSRHRDVARHPSGCGLPVVGLADEFQVCENPGLCVPDRNCMLSGWGDWSACSSRCFGLSERRREIVQYATGNGRPCHNESTKQVGPCNPGFGRLPPEGCGQPSPERCTLGQWAEWGECSASCGGGQKIRMRHVLSPATNDGEPCEGQLSETVACGMERCQEGCQDCHWGLWSDWSLCSKSGSQRFRHRSVAELPNHCGKPCDAAAAKEVSSCNGTYEEQTFCAWSDWSAYGPCSAQCGPATRLRQRALAAFLADPGSYLFEGPSSQACSGAQLDIGACEHRSCDAERASVDCLFGQWGDWTAPSCTQLCERHRVIDRMNQHHGKLCSGRLVETKRCPRACTHAEDCLLSDWGEWGRCQARESQRYRSRAVLQQASSGGRQCEGNLEETASCSAPPADAAPCGFGLWSAWSTCSQSCGGGLRTRERGLETPAERGGELCEGALQELSVCNAIECGGEALPCIVGDWGSWSDCAGDAAGSSRFRERKVLREPKNEGMPCNATLKEVTPCQQAADCVVSQWTAWDECDKSCGGGQQARHRQVVVPPQDGGEHCPSSLVELRGCNMAPCHRRDCAISDWGEWSRCTASCGSGQQQRSRRLTQLSEDGGEGCSSQLEETRPCLDAAGRGLVACPVADCVWGLWSDWSSCSSRCDGGTRTRDRHIIQVPQPGGKPCQAWNKEEAEPCNTQQCSDERCVDGQWEDWQDWEPCSRSCEGGITWRSRKVLSEANFCGKPAAGPSRITASCNAGVACEPDVDCAFSDWGPWGDCSRSCGGLARRSRGIAVPSRGQGASCEGELQQTAPCGHTPGQLTPWCLTDAPADCALGDWGPWQACSASCGGGQQHRARSVAAEARGGGRCPPAALSEVRPCGRRPCPGECAPADCRWGDWGAWSACDKCGGERRRSRHVLSVAHCGGEPCEPGLSEEVTTCTRSCHEPSYCAFGDWSSWGACSATCGSGVHERTRHLEVVGRLSSPRLLVDGPLQDAAGLQAKFRQEHLELQVLHQHALQRIALAFASGLLSLVVGLVALRACAQGGDRTRCADVRVLE